MVPDPDSDFEFDEDDFYTTYPNVQPHGERGSNRYYITFAWNNVSEVPRTFRVGNEDTTFAVRSGENETYFNAELRRLTTHCFYVLIHYNSGVGNVSNLVSLGHYKIQLSHSNNRSQWSDMWIFTAVKLVCGSEKKWYI